MMASQSETLPIMIVDEFFFFGIYEFSTDTEGLGSFFYSSSFMGAGPGLFLSSSLASFSSSVLFKGGGAIAAYTAPKLF